MFRRIFPCCQLLFHKSQLSAKTSDECNFILKCIKSNRFYNTLLTKHPSIQATTKSLLSPLELSETSLCSFPSNANQIYHSLCTKSGNTLQTKKSSFSHVNVSGKINMVDVGEKSVTHRIAKATGVIYIGERVFKLLQENELKKGSALIVADIAGIMAAKETSRFIPLCHSIPVVKAELTFQMNEAKYCVRVTSEVHTMAQTGVEMEALMAVSVSLLTIYDMCKAVNKNMVISDIKLLSKTGGKTDFNASYDEKENAI
ncbi:cyclic pyranopterin monophosphate synthase [Octopus bimaculoides]|uniref:cyclic pyranopterin monophosphate synthase n=1 Tax=Octopus bimaculoides TaxID=37653 RepID=A0A0L8I8C2_OCTBM|nr:cyclic pyranopterin monophosphate synthase [Octopus bimaculoides]|eukprot:XP_014787492.1 PREDICTED: cyclic pyranopterin monophosphate synthase accessory protein-like [Octopus bimaculoides]